MVLNNGGGGIFEFLPIARHRDGWDELFGTPTGLDLSAVAALYGLPFTRVEAHSELADALAQPGMVEVVLDRSATWSCTARCSSGSARRWSSGRYARIAARTQAMNTPWNGSRAYRPARGTFL